MIADDRHIRDSILVPSKQVVAGYVPIMPSFSGQVREADLLALIAYLKSKTAVANPPPEIGAKSARERN